MQKPFLEFSDDEFILTPFDTKPTKDFEFPTNENGDQFPFCCEHHRGIYEKAREWFDEFPNCCEKHIKMSRKKNFFKSSYQDVPMKIVKQVAYTEFHIEQLIHAEDWYNDITDYIEYNLKSFGHPQVGIEKYYGSIQRFIQDQKKTIPSEKQKLLLAYLKAQLEPVNGKGSQVSLNVLHSIYQKWVKAFPFEMTFFEPLKKQFENKLPIIDGQIKQNRYMDLASGKAITPERLIETLISNTKALLSEIDTAKLIQKGQISNAAKLQIELANQSHRIRQSSLLETYSKTEIRYITILKTWLANEKSYFQEILPLLNIEKNESKPEPDKITMLSAALKKYQFEHLTSVIRLTDNARQNLVKLMAIRELPYQIAMLEQIGFIDHLKKRFFKTNEKLFKGLATVLLANERSVKGNIYVLNSRSTENRSRYTAHLHIDEVTKDYEKLK